MAACILISVWASTASAAVTASLEPSPVTPSEFLPYQQAQLTVVNDSDAVLSGLALREQAGGPTIAIDMVIAPRTTQHANVLLPAVAVRQDYQLLSRPDGRALAAAPVAWPVSAVEAAREAFLDSDAYDPWQYDRPAWPQSALGLTLLLIVLAALGAGAAMFLRPAVGVAVVLLITAGATWGVLQTLLALPVVVDLSSLHPSAKQELGVWKVLAARRTAQAAEQPGTCVYAVYRSAAQMRRDSMVIDPAAGWTLSFQIEPDDIRVFRLGPGGLTAPSPRD